MCEARMKSNDWTACEIEQDGKLLCVCACERDMSHRTNKTSDRVFLSASVGVRERERLSVRGISHKEYNIQY